MNVHCLTKFDALIL